MFSRRWRWQSARPLDGQLTTGTFTATGGNLSFVPQQSSCAAAAPWSCTYRVSSGSLVLTDSGGTVSFSRGTATGTGVVTYGCFDSVGNFTPRPVSPL